MTTEPTRRVAAVVLAAGIGSRMRSRLPKVLHPVCGRPMLAYLLEAAQAATGARPLVVVSPHMEAVRATFAEVADFALQDEPRGTGDAVRAALGTLPLDTAEVAVLNGDVPLLDPAIVGTLLEARRERDAAMALVTVLVDEPGALGRVVRDGAGRVERIVEMKDAREEELAVGEVNAGLYAFDASWLRRRLPDVAPSPSSGEVYLPELVRLARADGLPVAALQVEDDGTLLGINDRGQLADAEVEMRLRINERHLLAGVTMLDPGSTIVDASVELAEDVTLEPGVILRGATRVGRDSRIRAGSQLFDTVVGERCVIWASVLESTVVEDDVRIGPFSHLRPGAHIGAGAELGNFAEVKSSRIGRGSKQHHMSYIGDADVGEGVNIGAGTITANFDGRRKHRTTIGDGAFIGSDTILRAPVVVGEGAVTGAGAVVTHDVPPGAVVTGVPARIRETRSGGAEAADAASEDPDAADGGGRDAAAAGSAVRDGGR
jgi:bifunctional UDP-N-acetylglucosamine pyrophosphorylase/glucosamine-1-phosphate N-acetyltransferase